MKLCFLVVVVCLAVQEWYPFSSFPMYSSLGDRTRYYYVTDQNDQPLAFVDEFGVRAAFFKKLFDQRQREMWNQAAAMLGQKAETEDWLRVESQAGEWALGYLRDRATHPLPKAQQLLLWRVDVMLDGTELHAGRRKIAEIPSDATAL